MSYNLWALVACILLLSLLITTAFLPSCFQGLTYWIRNDVVQSISLSEDRSNDVFKNMEKKSPADEEEIEYMKAYFTAEQSIPSERHFWNPYWRDPAAMKRFLEMIRGMPCDIPKDWCDSYFPWNETLAFQNFVWEHQHPPDCKKAKLYLYRYQLGETQGIGSVLHVLSAALGIALKDGRVLVPKGDFWFAANEPPCTDLTLNCYFYPITNCTIEDAGDPKEWVSVDRSTKLPYEGRVVINDIGYNGLWFDHWPEPWNKGTSIPATIKYLMRPKEWVLEYTERERMKAFPNGVIPHPLVSMHVRHGDKYKESFLISLDEYVRALKESGIVEKYGVKGIFISTEDPKVIEDTYMYPEFNWYWTKNPRLNTSPHHSARQLGLIREALIGWANLFLAVEADFFVGTRSSNWCRLIDEFRKVNGKARTWYITPLMDKHWDT